jgi:hypothetical protein
MHMQGSGDKCTDRRSDNPPAWLCWLIGGIPLVGCFVLFLYIALQEDKTHDLEKEIERLNLDCKSMRKKN